MGFVSTNKKNEAKLGHVWDTRSYFSSVITPFSIAASYSETLEFVAKVSSYVIVFSSRPLELVMFFVMHWARAYRTKMLEQLHIARVLRVT